MGTVIKDLVTAAHALSNEMTGAPSALVRELASRLDVQRVCHEKAREVTNCPQGVELQEHLKQLVAENVAMKESSVNCVHAVAFWNSWADAEDKIHLSPETPATDSILREAEARGVELVAKKSRIVYQERHSVCDFGTAEKYLTSAVLAENIANDLREGKAE